MNTSVNAQNQNTTRRQSTQGGLLKSALIGLGLVAALSASLTQASPIVDANAQMRVYTFTYSFDQRQDVIVSQTNELRQYLEFDRLVEIDRQLHNNMLQIGEDVANFGRIAKSKGFDLPEVSVEAE